MSFVTGTLLGVALLVEIVETRNEQEKKILRKLILTKMAMNMNMRRRRRINLVAQDTILQ